MTRGSTPGVHAPDEGELGRPQGDGGAVVLNFACENGLTDVADLLLQHSAQLEHESEGWRTTPVEASRAGYLCTVQFFVFRGSDVNRPNRGLPTTSGA